MVCESHGAATPRAVKCFAADCHSVAERNDRDGPPPAKASTRQARLRHDYGAASVLCSVEETSDACVELVVQKSGCGCWVTPRSNGSRSPTVPDPIARAEVV